jgi:hypothetical protein
MYINLFRLIRSYVPFIEETSKKKKQKEKAKPNWAGPAAGQTLTISVLANIPPLKP